MDGEYLHHPHFLREDLEAVRHTPRGLYLKPKNVESKTGLYTRRDKRGDCRESTRKPVGHGIWDLYDLVPQHRQRVPKISSTTRRGHGLRLKLAV
jgi:hypothetical protein